MTTTQEADRLAEEARVAAMRFGNACEHHGYDTPTALERERQLFTAIDRLRDLSRNPSVEGDARDAARYRWLRDYSNPGVCAFYLSVGKAFEGVKFAGKTVDEAIDAQITAAMAATPKEPR